MTAHELARKLLEGPDLPVTIPVGYHSSGEYFEEADGVFKVDALDDPKSERHFPHDHIHIYYEL